MIGTKIKHTDFKLYFKMADFCNVPENHAGIIDRGEYYEVIDTTPTEKETLENEIESIDRKISEIESKLQRSLLDVVIGSIFPLELNADDKKENAESKKYLLQYWKDKKELRRQRTDKLKRIEALKNVISR